MKAISVSVLAGVLATPASACDLCSIYSATQASGESGRGFYAGVAEQFTSFGTLQDEGRKAPNDIGQYINSSLSQLYAGYNFTDRLGVQFNLPVIYRSFKRPRGDVIEQSTESGIGDSSLSGSLL